MKSVESGGFVFLMTQDHKSSKNFFQIVGNATHDRVREVASDTKNLAVGVKDLDKDVEAVAEDVKEVAEDVEAVAESIANVTKLLNNLIKKHYGEPVYSNWWFGKLTDIIHGSIPPDSEFLFPNDLGSWLTPQYGMMLLIGFAVKIGTWLDSRSGSRLCKKYNIHLHPACKVLNCRDKILFISITSSLKPARVPKAFQSPSLS